MKGWKTKAVVELTAAGLVGGGVAWAAGGTTAAPPAQKPVSPPRAAGRIAPPVVGRRHPVLEHLAHGDLTVVIAGQTLQLRVDHGRITGMSEGVLSLSEADGSNANVPVDGATRVFVDGRQATLADLKTGYVAFAVAEAGKPAHAIRAFDAPSWAAQAAEQAALPFD